MEAKRVISLVLTIALVLGIWAAPVNVAADQDAIISMTIGSTKAYVNLVPKTLDQPPVIINGRTMVPFRFICLLYTSDAADDLLCVDLGGRRIIKKKNHSKI